MNWLAFVIALFLPVMQQGVQRVQQRVEARMAQQQQAQQQPHIVFHEGRWWKLENNVWYVWTATPQGGVQ